MSDEIGTKNLIDLSLKVAKYCEIGLKFKIDQKIPGKNVKKVRKIWEEKM